MEKITVTIEGFGNAAFEGNESGETARILRELADKIESGRLPETLLDVNGNAVGKVKYR